MTALVHLAYALGGALVALAIRRYVPIATAFLTRCGL